MAKIEYPKPSTYKSPTYNWKDKYKVFETRRDSYEITGDNGQTYTMSFKDDKYRSDDLFSTDTNRRYAAVMAQLTLDLGKTPSKEELLDALGIEDISDSAYGTYVQDNQLFLKEHAINIDKAGNINYTEKPKETYDPNFNPFNLITDPHSVQAQDYKQSMYGAIDTQQKEVDQTLAAAELDAYRMLGQKQLQLENQIADQRMRALRSGTTSAQLASQNLQNLFAAQSSAMEIASQTMQQRVGMGQQFAQQRAEVTPSLYQMVEQNRMGLAGVEAQRYAAQMGYKSYSPYEQAKAFLNQPQIMSQYEKLKEQ